MKDQFKVINLKIHRKCFKIIMKQTLKKKSQLKVINLKKYKKYLIIIMKINYK